MLTIDNLQRTNAERAFKWHANGKEIWTPLEWAGAMCGEAGEAANFAKKIKRLRTQLPNKEAGIDIKDLSATEAKCAKECADTIIYALLLIDQLGYEAETVIREVFNKKSIEYGFPERV